MSNLSAFVHFKAPADKYYMLSNHPWEREYRWINNLQYFIEDGLALTSRIELFKYDDAKGFDMDSDIDYLYSMTFTYYLDRHLFK